MKKVAFLLLVTLTLISCKEKQTEESITETPSEEVKTDIENSLNILPISHATMILEWDDKILYIDPVGGADAFKNYPKADLILITDIHGDHFNLETLEAVSNSKVKIIVPQAVANKLPESFDAQIDVLNNGDTKERYGFMVEAIPMYNLREEALKFHEKGRGNGYVIENNNMRVYISGDTEDIPEMRALKDIDIAFVCMNLPYTMTVESAADAVLEFQPITVYPYHYRGTEGMSNVSKFDSIVKVNNPNITVIQLEWYKP